MLLGITTSGLISRYLEARLDVSKVTLKWGTRTSLRELAVDVDGVQAGNEVDEDIVHAFGHLLQKSRSDLFIRWIFGEVNRDEKLFSFCVDIADIDTAFVGKEDPIALLVERLVLMLQQERLE